ncbi:MULTISPECIES: sensor histidine kinase [Streptomyces]|uniref:histidine kinase n=1 Tax=Streptomyces lycii TaxID=2654337 RepID=A0ABQ7FIB5_9ACTN|nr:MULTISPECIES: histidine kinase [Streptomyces]KAF4408348.1 two-component sensor histidine kinase [Streptomyces lycii]PGH51915.1 two-component sensor histidine kinase [Streptomyces sp. Ru87]
MTRAPWHRRHPVAVDVAIAVVLTLVDTWSTLAGQTWWPEDPGATAHVLLGVQAAACLSLAVRRRAPLTVVAVLGAFTLLVTLLVAPLGVLAPADRGNLWAPFSTALAAYGPLFYTQRRQGCRSGGTDGADPRGRRTALVVLALFTVVVARPWELSPTVITIGLLRTAVGPLLALYFDARRRLVLALTERAERAERERHLLAEQARAEERARLAGEMHDVVTHRVSLMVLQAGALRMTAADETTRQAAEELRAAGCQAMEELRDLVGILRTAPEGDRTPSVGGFPALVAESTAVGVPAELVEEGDRSLASPVVGRTAYRVVREALTNVRKHAPGARVTVRVEYEEAQVRVTVRNTRPPEGAGAAGNGLARTGSGLGIVNLRQRMELVHGTLRAGPAPDGGFSVEAVLPAYVPTAETAV